MRIGVVYPQTEFPSDPAAIKDYAQTAEGLGFQHIIAYDHVLGANPDRPGGLNGPYTHLSAFQEPFVLFSYLASVTQTIEFTTSIIILPQRQTALVAKQAATLDILSGGRLRLGVGLGWNNVEYEALNENFHNRGKRLEEQIQLMRMLWTQSLVTYNGRWHKISDAGLNPLPVQRPIPVWFGGHSQQQLQRAARLGDGWMPIYRKPSDAAASLEYLHQCLAQEGRVDQSFGIEARMPYGSPDPTTWLRYRDEWQVLGATHLCVNTMGFGFSTPNQHIDAITRFAQAILPG